MKKAFPKATQKPIAFLKGVEGGQAQQSSDSKGTTGKYGHLSGPEGPTQMSNHLPGADPVPPRSLYSAEVGLGVVGDVRHPLTTAPTGTRPTGDLHNNPASTGKQSLGKAIMHAPQSPVTTNPLKTGAGQGNKIVRKVGKSKGL